MIHRWYSECNLEDFGLSRRTLLFAYFLASSSIFEPEKSIERITWTKTTALVEAISYYFDEEEMRRDFLQEFRNSNNTLDYIYIR
jgi:ent-copalyl diphosphate synthase